MGEFYDPIAYCDACDGAYERELEREHDQWLEESHDRWVQDLKIRWYLAMNIPNPRNLVTLGGITEDVHRSWRDRFAEQLWMRTKARLGEYL